LPWIIVGVAVLLSGVGLTLVVLLTGKNDGPADNPAAAATSASSASSSSTAPDLTVCDFF
jgi:hypothetical protein